MPGRSAMKTWASGVSFQSILVLDMAVVSLAKAGSDAARVLKLNGIQGSQMSREKGSKTLVRLPKKLGMIDIFCELGFGKTNPRE